MLFKSYLFLTLKGDGRHQIHYFTDFLKKKSVKILRIENQTVHKVFKSLQGKKSQIKFLENCVSTELLFETITLQNFLKQSGKKKKKSEAQENKVGPKAGRILSILSKEIKGEKVIQIRQW